MRPPEYEHPHHTLIQLKHSESHGELPHVQKKQDLEHFQLVWLLAQRHLQSEDTPKRGNYVDPVRYAQEH